jgi:hypothetical protein
MAAINLQATKLSVVQVENMDLYICAFHLPLAAFTVTIKSLL